MLDEVAVLRQHRAHVVGNRRARHVVLGERRRGGRQEKHGGGGEAQARHQGSGCELAQRDADLVLT